MEKKDFNFGFSGHNKTKADQNLDTNKRKKTKIRQTTNKGEELLLENEALRCENELLKKLQALIQAEESQKAQAIMELRHKFDLNLNQTNMAQVILLSSKK
jgi:hypothetical protein